MKKKRQKVKSVDEWGDEEKWVTIVDFTKIRRGGISIKEVMRAIKKMEKPRD